MCGWINPPKSPKTSQVNQHPISNVANIVLKTTEPQDISMDLWFVGIVK